MLVIGGIYLCWLGFQMLKLAFSKTPVAEQQKFELPQSNLRFSKRVSNQFIQSESRDLFCERYFQYSLANPNLDGVHSLLFVIVSIETLIWFSFVAFVFSLPSFKAAYQNAAKWIDGISGGIFTLFGAYLIGNR